MYLFIKFFKFVLLLLLIDLGFVLISVVGLNFDYAVLNMVKQCYYLVYNTTLYFSPVVQRQYGNKYGHKQVIYYTILYKKHVFGCVFYHNRHDIMGCGTQ